MKMGEVGRRGALSPSRQSRRGETWPHLRHRPIAAAGEGEGGGEVCRIWRLAARPGQQQL